MRRLALACLALAALWACEEERKPRGTPPPAQTTGSGGDVFVGSATVGTGGADTSILDPDAPCDGSLDLDASDPRDAARAVGLCKDKEGDDDWGVVGAAWVMPDGAAPIESESFDLGHGILAAFGDDVEPLEGERMLLLSSGTAREPGQPDFAPPVGFDKAYSGEHPDGFPQEAPACPNVLTGDPFDGIALEVELVPPPGANALSFSFDFFTYEWPHYICSPFNDHFLALASPPPEGAVAGNVSFDQDGNVVSVNNALLRVCDCDGGPPCEAPPAEPFKEFECELGDDELDGTGFEGAAATSWLVTTAPVSPGEPIRLRWAVYDSGDGVLDSTVVLDRFRWQGDPTENPETVPDVK